MNVELIQKFMQVAIRNFKQIHINYNMELIIEPRTNIYFRLEGIETEFDLKRKVISWLSRPSCKGVSAAMQKKFRELFNEVLGTSFTHEELEHIYTYLGNDCNRKMCIDFINSNYDISILKRG